MQNGQDLFFHFQSNLRSYEKKGKEETIFTLKIWFFVFAATTLPWTIEKSVNLEWYLGMTDLDLNFQKEVIKRGVLLIYVFIGDERKKKVVVFVGFPGFMLSFLENSDPPFFLKCFVPHPLHSTEKPNQRTFSKPPSSFSTIWISWKLLQGLKHFPPTSSPEFEFWMKPLFPPTQHPLRR